MADVKVKFISVWNGGFEVETNALFNPTTRAVSNIEGSDIEVDDDGDALEFLDYQCIELIDTGERLTVQLDADIADECH